MTDEYAELDATVQSALIRRGEVRPIELVDAAITRTERLNLVLDAVGHLLRQRVQGGATDGIETCTPD